MRASNPWVARCGSNIGRRVIAIYPEGGKRRVMLYARFVMEQHLGRTLETWEHVHHIDGDCTNDVLENLEVLNAREHMELHHRLRRAAAV